uniref:Small serum protein 2 n=1 Tax=Callorhinchus milii TaxID=7868 RepID=K4GB09_CALMI|nr:small serum protein 2 [Callorhinchus milii]
MKLTCAFLLLAAITLSEPYCFVFRHEETDDPSVKCKDSSDGSYHAIGDSWRNSQCGDCGCGANVGSCCAAMARPIAPENCVAMLDLQRCQYTVYRKDDPSVPCQAMASVGK